MEWYHYLSAFFAGAFLANAVPHFVNGVSGNKFPTPFANPPGKGLSSALVNVLWGIFNLVVGYILLKPGHVDGDNIPALLVFAVGGTLLSVMGAVNFPKRDKE